MAGYWKIPKEWIQEQGLTWNEAGVLADCLDWPQCTIEKRAERCGLSKRSIISVMSRLKQKNLIGAKSAPSTVQNLHQNGAKSAPSTVQNLHQNGAKSAPNDGAKFALPPTPPLLEEQEKKNKEAQGETRTHACEAPLEKNEAQEKKIYEIVLRKWKAHYKRHYATEYIPDYRSLTNDTQTIAEAVAKKMAEHGRDPGNEADAKEFVDDMFEAMRTVADTWQRERWSLHTVATQFNELYQKIINGNGTSTNSNNPGITQDYLARTLQDAFGDGRP